MTQPLARTIRKKRSSSHIVNGTPTPSVLLQGTASPEAKSRLTHTFNLFCREDPVYGANVARKMVLVEANVITAQPSLYQGRGGGGASSMDGAELICEIVCEEDMCGPHKVMHAGCATYLAIMCTSAVLAILGDPVQVSQNLSMAFHAPAKLGSKLRMISNTGAIGHKFIDTRCEIWDVENARVVATATHMRAMPGRAKL